MIALLGRLLGLAEPEPAPADPGATAEMAPLKDLCLARLASCVDALPDDALEFVPGALVAALLRRVADDGQRLRLLLAPACAARDDADEAWALLAAEGGGAGGGLRVLAGTGARETALARLVGRQLAGGEIPDPRAVALVAPRLGAADLELAGPPPGLLEGAAGLRALSLSRLPRAEAVAAAAAALRAAPQLRRLALAGCALGDEGAVALSSAVSAVSPGSLEELDVRWCCIGAAGARALAGALPPSLQLLRFAHNASGAALVETQRALRAAPAGVRVELV